MVRKAKVFEWYRLRKDLKRVVTDDSHHLLPVRVPSFYKDVVKAKKLE